MVIQGCTWAGPVTQIENWPDLKVVEHWVSWHEMQAVCAKYAPFMATVHACAEFNFKARECHIWITPDRDDLIAYERDNCAGRTKPFWKERLEEIRDRFNKETG